MSGWTFDERRIFSSSLFLLFRVEFGTGYLRELNHNAIKETDTFVRNLSECWNLWWKFQVRNIQGLQNSAHLSLALAFGSILRFHQRLYLLFNHHFYAKHILYLF